MIEKVGRRKTVSIRLKMAMEDVRIAFLGTCPFSPKSIYADFDHKVLHSSPRDPFIHLMFLPPDDAYADNGFETPRNLEPISAVLWELLDEEVDASPLFGHEDSGEKDIVGNEVSGKEVEEVTRIEESEDEALEKSPEEEKPSKENEDGEYDEEYEEDGSWKDEDSDDTGSRSLESSSEEESTNESSDEEESDFVDV